MSQRRSVVAVSVKPKGFKLGHKQGSMSTTSPPPSSPDGNVSTSGPSAIKLSKNWELPQRLKPGRKPKSKRGDASANNDGSSKIKKVQTSNQKDQMTTKDHENEGAKGHGENLMMKATEVVMKTVSIAWKSEGGKIEMRKEHIGNAEQQESRFWKKRLRCYTIWSMIGKGNINCWNLSFPIQRKTCKNQ